MAETDFEKFTRSFTPGEVVFEEGAAAAHMYVVQAGAVQIRKAGVAGILVTLGPGEIFGELALVDGAPRSATAVAGADGARLLQIDHALFVYVVGQQPAFALMVMQSMARRLRAHAGPDIE